MASPVVPKLLRYVEWMFLGWLALMTFPQLFAEGELTVIECIEIGTIALLIGFSVITPEQRSLRQRRLYVLAGLAVIMPVQLVPFMIGQNSYVALIGFFVYLFLAKACFLLPRRDVITAVILTGLVWHGGLVWSYFALMEPLQEAIRQYQETLQQLADSTSQPSLWAIGLRIALSISVFWIPFTGLLVWLCLKATSEHKNRQAVLALSAQAEILATDLERTRVARDVHDSLGHTLTTLDIQLKLARALYPQQPERALTALTQAKGLAEQSLVDMQQTVSVTQPADFDLRATLALLIAQMNHCQSCLFEARIDDLPKLPLEMSEQLYLLIKEGLTNVQKHSQAAISQLHIQTGLNTISINLIDDGMGFNPNAPTAGFGLQGMAERVQILKGQITIRSRLGKGTLIDITVPRPASPSG
ncbi:MAG: sensor histidine kinase [Cyanobacteria bacterium P01_D01_bin.115]